jgi:hypothetical protein
MLGTRPNEDAGLAGKENQRLERRTVPQTRSEIEARPEVGAKKTAKVGQMSGASQGPRGRQGQKYSQIAGAAQGGRDSPGSVPAGEYTEIYRRGVRDQRGAAREIDGG